MADIMPIGSGVCICGPDDPRRAGDRPVAANRPGSSPWIGP